MEVHLLNCWIEFSTFYQKPEEKATLRQPTNFLAFSHYFEEVNNYPISEEFESVIFRFLKFAMENPEFKF
jgi:hypothetical protein